MINKKGQVGTVIMYAASIIIIALFLYFGVGVIAKLVNVNQDINYDMMKSNLINDIDSIAKNFGSQRLIEVKIPSEYDSIIFANCTSGATHSQDIITNECLNYGDGDYNNIFLQSGTKIVPIGHNDKIRIADGSGDITIKSKNGIAKVFISNEGKYITVNQG